MMRALYRLLLRLYPETVRVKFADEMLAVFDEARTHERARGPAALTRFYCREAGGIILNLLMEERSMKHRRIILQGSLAGLLTGCVFAFAWSSRPYTSTALLRLRSPMIPESLVPAQTRVEPQQFMPRIIQVVTTRAALSKTINDHNLYATERARMPMEEVVSRMRDDVRISSAGPDGVTVGYSYTDRVIAQKVTAELVNRIIQEFRRERTVAARLTVEFLNDRVDEAARAWDSGVAAARAAEAQGKPSPRATLDAGVAQQRYEALSAKLAEAETVKVLTEREQGQVLEVLDPPSLPAESPTTIFMAAPLGALAGALLGWLVAVALAYRARTPVPHAA